MKHFVSRRFLLRDCTAAAHAALDATVGQLTTRDVYARYLRGIHAFRAAAEPLLATAPWRPKSLASLLGADLADLGLPPRAAVSLDLPEDYSSLLGLAYVLEGSALGARLLYPEACALGMSADHGARHLAQQAGDRDAWRAFCSALDAAAPYDPDAAATAAAAAFDAARAAFADHAG